MLRELAESDVAPLHGVYGNEEATRHLSFEPRTTDQVEGIIKAAMKAATAEPRTEYALAVAGKDGELIGSARLATGEHESGQIGFALRPDHWGQGRAWRLSGSFSSSDSGNSACTGSGVRGAL